MKKLGDFGDKDAAIERGERMIDEGYVVVVTEQQLRAEGDKGPLFNPRYIVWGTKSRTMFTGGWNR